MLQKMYEAHALHQWDSIETYSVHLTDEFYGLIGKFGNPFPNNKADFEFQAIPGTFSSKVTFRDKKWKGKVWGIQSWRTFSSNKTGGIELHANNDKTIEFWLPTYQYFIEIPLRVFEANVISYAGERKMNGRTFDLVFATWKTGNPQKDIDQYILWIDQANHRLAQMQYTVRDEYKWIHATLKYTKYETKDGILIPSEMKVNLFGPEKKKVFHKVSIKNIKFNQITQDSFILYPALGLNGKR